MRRSKARKTNYHFSLNGGLPVINDTCCERGRTFLPKYFRNVEALYVVESNQRKISNLMDLIKLNIFIHLYNLINLINLISLLNLIYLLYDILSFCEMLIIYIPGLCVSSSDHTFVWLAQKLFFYEGATD